MDSLWVRRARPGQALRLPLAACSGSQRLRNPGDAPGRARPNSPHDKGIRLGRARIPGFSEGRPVHCGAPTGNPHRNQATRPDFAPDPMTALSALDVTMHHAPDVLTHSPPRTHLVTQRNHILNRNAPHSTQPLTHTTQLIDNYSTISARPTPDLLLLLHPLRSPYTPAKRVYGDLSGWSTAHTQHA